MYDNFSDEDELDSNIGSEDELNSDTSSNDYDSDSSSDSDEEGVKWPAMHRAASNDQTKKLQRLIQEAGLDESTDDYGFAPLHHAVIDYSTDATELLLEAGADVDIKTKFPENESLMFQERIPLGSTPLHIAAITNNLTLAEMLLDFDADVDATTKIYDPRRHWQDEELYHGEDILLGATPLHFAAYYGHADIADLLIDADAMDWKKDSKGFTALDYAVMEGHIDTVNVFLSYEGASVNQVCAGQSLLLFLYYRDRSAFMEWLAEDNTNINIIDSNGEPLLHLAYKSKGKNLFYSLLEHPTADLNIKDSEDMAILSLAIESGDASTIAYIRNISEQRLRNKIDPNTYKERIVEKKAYREAEQHWEETYPQLYCEHDETWMGEIYEAEGYPYTFKEFWEEAGLRDSYRKGDEAFIQQIQQPNPADAHPADGLSYLQRAIQLKKPSVIIEIIKYLDLDLDYTAEAQKKAVGLAKAQLTEQELKTVYKLQADIHKAFRDAHRYKKNHFKGLEEILRQYCLADLQKLTFIAKAELNGKSLIEGFLNFSLWKSKQASLTKENFAETLDRVIKAKHKDDNTGVLSNRAINYMLIQAGYHSHNLEVSSGGSEDEDEKSLAEINLHKWLGLSTNEANFLYTRLDQSIAKSTKPSLNNTDKILKLIPLFRGINFLRDRYNHQEKMAYLQNALERQTFYCAASYNLAGGKPGETTISEELLEEKVSKIVELIEKLNNTQAIAKWWNQKNKPWKFNCVRDAIQAYYTYNKDGFDKNIIKQMPKEVRQIVEQIAPDLATIFAENPFVSASALPWHSVRYALGNSRASSKRDYILNPRYNSKTGIPKYPIVGVVFVALYSTDAYEQAGAYNIPREHAKGNISISHELLQETEVTFPGKMENVVLSLPIIYPSFATEHSTQIAQQFGLNKTNYDYFKRSIHATKRHELKRRELEGKLREHLIEHYSKKLLEIAQNEAKARNALLVIEHPDGEYKEYKSGQQTPYKLKEEAIKMVKKDSSASISQDKTVTGNKRKREIESSKPNKKSKLTCKEKLASTSKEVVDYFSFYAKSKKNDSDKTINTQAKFSEINELRQQGFFAKKTKHKPIANWDNNLYLANAPDNDENLATQQNPFAS